MFGFLGDSSVFNVIFWLSFWFLLQYFSRFFVRAFVSDGPDSGRLALRVVSTVHAVLACIEVYETYTLRNQLWPPSVYGAKSDVTCVYWYEFVLAYYWWDLLTVLYTQYGYVFMIHGAVSFPPFLFAIMSPETQFLWGFYGRFYHGIFSLSTPWLHVRELLIAAKNPNSVFKLPMEFFFVLTFVVVRIIFGTYFSLRIMYEMIYLLMFGSVHSTFAFVVVIACCIAVVSLQLYWFIYEIIPAILNVFKKKDKIHKTRKNRLIKI